MLVVADPNHTRAQNNRVYYKKTIEEEVAKSGAATDSIDYSPHGDPVNRRPLDSYKSSDEFQKYERLCRGDEVIVSTYDVTSGETFWMTILAEKMPKQMHACDRPGYTMRLEKNLRRMNSGE
jgi:hypothetical protein